MVSRLAAIALAGVTLALGAVPAAHAASSWRFEHPAGSPFQVPFGLPGDLKLLSPSRGLLTVQGNAAVPRGVMTWNGRTWRTYATVCGGEGGTNRLAVAGPSEFWVVADPPRELNTGEYGTTLCHFRDGAVVKSYAERPDVLGAYGPMSAAACLGAATCWFGGAYREGAGGRRGAFHLRWDGAAVAPAYNPQGRGVSDIEGYEGELWESSYLGRDAGVEGEPFLAQPETQPSLLRRLTPGGFVAEAQALPDGTELLALDADTERLWAGGGGAASGPDVSADQPVMPTGPLLMVRREGAWHNVPLPSLDESRFAPDERIVDIAAVPGTNVAWVAVQDFYLPTPPDVPARVLLIREDGEILADERLEGNGTGRGRASRIDCASATECWMVTELGWLFHWTDGAPLPEDTSPAYAGTITVRPDDNRTPQRIVDAPAEDDSLRNAPPPTVEQPQPPAEDGTALKALISNVKAKLRGKRTLVLRFKLARKAKVGVVGRRKGKVVARTKQRTLRKGRRSIELRFDPKRFPAKIAFTTKELTKAGKEAEKVSGGGGSGDDDTVTTTGAVASGQGTAAR